MGISNLPASSASSSGLGNIYDGLPAPAFSISVGSTSVWAQNQTVSIPAGTYKVYSQYTTNTNPQYTTIGYSRQGTYKIGSATTAVGVYGSDASTVLTLSATNSVDVYQATARTSVYISSGSFGTTTSNWSNCFYLNGYIAWQDVTSRTMYYATYPTTTTPTVTTGVTLTNTMNSMTYGNGIYVVGMFGTTNSFAYSSSISGPYTVSAVATLTGQVNCVTYSTAANIFVAGDQYGNIWSSTNAVAWTNRQAITNGNHQYIAAPNTGTYKFLAGVGGSSGATNTAYVSTDGITWTSRTLGTTSIVYSMELWGTYYQAMCFNSTSGPSNYYSTDTVTWTAGGFPSAGPGSAPVFATTQNTNPLFIYYKGSSNGPVYSQGTSPSYLFTESITFSSWDGVSQSANIQSAGPGPGQLYVYDWSKAKANFYFHQIPTGTVLAI